MFYSTLSETLRSQSLKLVLALPCSSMRAHVLLWLLLAAEAASTCLPCCEEPLPGAPCCCRPPGCPVAPSCPAPPPPPFPKVEPTGDVIFNIPGQEYMLVFTAAQGGCLTRVVDQLSGSDVLAQPLELVHDGAASSFCAPSMLNITTRTLRTLAFVAATATHELRVNITAAPHGLGGVRIAHQVLKTALHHVLHSPPRRPRRSPHRVPLCHPGDPWRRRQQVQRTPATEHAADRIRLHVHGRRARAAHATRW